MKKQLLLLSLIFSMMAGYAQHAPIDQSEYTILSVSSDNNDHSVEHAFDDNVLTWWALYNDEGFELPSHVDIDLGQEYDLGGFRYMPNPNNATSKATSYTLYLSSDGETWAAPEVAGNFDFVDNDDATEQEVTFGAVTTRYVRLSYEASLADNGNVHTQELVFLSDSTLATGQANQIITFDAIEDKFATAADFEVVATTNSGLDVTYSIVEGPATVDGSTITLTGEGGRVVVQATQAGDDDYYPSSATTSFVVTNLNDYSPVVTTRLSANYPIEMPTLSAYPIYINTSIEQAEYLSIELVEVLVGGDPITVVEDNGFYYSLWTPSDYGSHIIQIIVTADNGNTTTITREIEVVDAAATQEVTTLEDVVIWFGQENSRWYQGGGYHLPQSVGAYDQVIAHLEVECPDGNCDDWDRRSFLDIKGPDGDWIQIFRYITSYNVACNHSIDVTDYISLLQGEVEFRAFVDTWGTGGWQYTVVFEYIEGTPDYKYSNVAKIWDDLYPLGNPINLQPVGTVGYNFPEGTEASTLRLSTTGHGWGANNSLNAAEFYHALNYVDVNGEYKFTQDLWNDCNPNPDGCTGQQGTWQHNRAGWCPGAISPPNIYNLTEYITDGGLDMHYRFAPSYVDLCHPDHPDCYSGITCENCDDGYAAVYDVDAHVISWSNTPLVYDPNTVVGTAEKEALEYAVNTYPNPTQDRFQITAKDIEGECFVFITGIDGRQINGYRFKTVADMEAYKFSLAKVEAGTYFVTIQNKHGMGVRKITKF